MYYLCTLLSHLNFGLKWNDETIDGSLLIKNVIELQSMDNMYNLVFKVSVIIFDFRQQFQGNIKQVIGMLNRTNI